VVVESVSMLINLLRRDKRACISVQILFRDISLAETKVYMKYCYTIFQGNLKNMDVNAKTEKIRWQVVRAMLDEFPTLKEKVATYLKERKLEQ
jgi:hypothetical protein